MRKVVMTAAAAALITASPVLAKGGGDSGSSVPSLQAAWGQVMTGFWRSALEAPPGFSSTGQHSGWFIGKHWGWFKPHHPNWPHEPPTSP